MVGQKQTNSRVGRNKRYEENDAAIIEAILKHRRHITVQQISKQLKISRTVFYNHYKSIDQVMTSFENELMREFAHNIKQLPKATSLKDNERLFREMFMFMTHNGNKTFYHICKNVDNHGMLFRMMAILYPKLYVNWGDKEPPMSDDAVHVFFSVAVVFISRWGAGEHCERRKIWRYLRKLQKLSLNARQICVEPFV